MSSGSTFVIESRIQLFSALAEASEIEHNLMCLYLYARFSLKKSLDEGVSAEELEAIQGWRKVILSVALEEMTHLTLVSNLLSAMGGGPNFMRPNFPCSPGPYPADIVIELTPFDMSTIEHFMYLERPRTEELADGPTFEHTQKYTRLAEKGRLMPTSGDYETVGALYLSIRDAVIDLCERLGEKNLFCGSRDLQIGPLDSSLPGLTLITNKDEALKALDTIISQGEGATHVKDSHFQRFCRIRDEYEALLKKNPAFVPARPVARNPVMRKPVSPEHRVWVREELAADFMDLANALYGMMLRTLVQIYSVEQRTPASKAVLLRGSTTLMHAMASVAETLTYMPANAQVPGVLSGMSFAMVRFLAPLKAEAEKTILAERCGEFLETLERLKQRLADRSIASGPIDACLRQLQFTSNAVKDLRTELTGLSEPSPQASAPAPAPTAADESPGIEISESDSIRITYDGKKCIHSRHCVTELPQVFKANTPGKWIFAEKTHPEFLAAVARECPSGAIQYTRKDGGPEEPVPPVNLMHVRENGPYAFLGDLVIDGKSAGMRATLCRCGQSQNKPFCDGAHNAASFSATGNPATMDDTPLKVRDGKLEIKRFRNGPLSVQGNIEICAGTGRVVLRTEQATLCRCGHSKNKPLCDNSHIEAGFRDDLTPVPTHLTAPAPAQHSGPGA